MSFIFCFFVRKEDIVSIILCVYSVALLISNYYSDLQTEEKNAIVY